MAAKQTAIERACARPPMRDRHGPGAAVAELCRLGLRPALRYTVDGASGSGAGLALPVREVLATPALAAQLLRRVRELLIRGIPVTLSLHDLGRENAPRLEQLLKRLRRATSAPCIDRSRLGLVVRAGALPLPAFVLMSRAWLGDGPRYVMLDRQHFDADTRDSEGRAVWSLLYQQRQRQRRLLPVYRGDVRTRCPLLSDEASDAILSPGALLAPADSAWLPVVVDLCRHADDRGNVHVEALQLALRRGLGIADRLLDRLHWADPGQAADAGRNRRIGVVLQGIAELVARQRADPASIACLRELDGLLRKVHDTLWEHSRRLAHRRGLLPALAERDPLRGLAAGARREDWRRRWHDALDGAAVRHRNLLVLSPYALLPQSSAGRVQSLDLLPLLAHADALSFAAPPRFAHWSINEFKDFHRRACAVIGRRNAASFVAAGV